MLVSVAAWWLLLLMVVRLAGILRGHFRKRQWRKMDATYLRYLFSFFLFLPQRNVLLAMVARYYSLCHIAIITRAGALAETQGRGGGAGPLGLECHPSVSHKRS